MIYLLSGLLVIHGIVCILGAFFPFYPPVYLFYWIFSETAFAIRLIIILLAGAFQVIYGGYLLLKKRWQVRWYWLALTVVVFAGLLLIFPAYHGLFTRVHSGGETHPIPTTEPPPYPSARPGPERPDDIIQTPGGLAYRANVHQEGVENPWPPIESKDVILASNKYSPQITYRDYIETKAGESRNNILHINTGGRGIHELNLDTINIPTGIEVKRGIRWQGPGTIAQVLVIEIVHDIQPAEYTFEISVEINGTDCGAVPCTIEVTGSTSPNNHGMTGITVQPEPGQYLVYDNQESAGVILKAVTIKSDVCDRDYMDLRGHATVRKGEPCLLVTGQVESQLDQDKYMTLSARGYDVNGEEVTYVLDAGPIWGVISIFVPAKGINEFVLHLKTTPDIVKIEFMPSPELYDIPPP